MRETEVSSGDEKAQRFQTEGRGIVNAAAGYYVVRRADEELFEHLAESAYCHVLAPRQIGKSSMRVRTSERLRARGIRCASVDLTGIGSSASPDEWYFSLAAAIAEALDLDADPADVWKEGRRLSPVSRFRQFLHDAVLGPEGPPVVVFIDEIDVTLSLPFSRDDFFGMIRALQQARNDDATWKRITFCLIGVAAPLDLIANPERTPFSSSMAVTLEDFSRDEAKVFLPGLATAGEDPEALLDTVLAWTDGHPALTQRLCYRLAEAGAAAGRAPEGTAAGGARVDALVRELFLASGRIEDPILLDAERRFAGDRPDARIPVMLHLYQRLLADERIPADGNNPRQFGLRIAGLAAERRDAEGTHLRTRNQIFAKVFNRGWVEERLARRFLTEPLQIWKDAGRNDSHVLRGGSLEIALNWAQGREDVSPDEHDFLNASQKVARKEAEQERQAERDRTERELADQKREIAERRAHDESRNARIGTFTAIVGLLLAVVAGTAWWNVDQSRRETASALRDAKAKTAEANELLAQRERAIAAIETELRTNAERAKQQEDEAKRQKDLAEKKVSDAEADAEKARKELEETQKAFGATSTKTSQSRDKLKKQNEALSRLMSEAKAAAAREADAKEAAANARNAMSQKDSIIRSLQEALKATREEADRNRVDLQKVRNEKAAAERERDEARTQLEQLKLQQRQFAVPPPAAPQRDAGPTDPYQ